MTFMKFSSTAFVSTAAALAGAVISVTAAAPAAFAQEGQIISTVEVRGVKNTNPDVVRLASGLKSGAPFRAEEFNEAKQRIRDKGLYSSVFARTETSPDGKLTVIFEVIENPVISNVIITGNRAVSEADLKPLLVSQAGNVLNTVDVDRDVQRILDLYQTRGFLAYVSDEVKIDPATSVLRIPIEEVVVEEVVVEGNAKTKKFVITREMRTKPGDSYNINTVQRDLTRVFNLGILADIGPARREPGSDLGKVKLVIPVQEQRTGQVGVVFGYSVRQRLTGTLQLSETNFRGRGQGVNFSWTVGGIAARNQFEVGFSEPWIDRHNTSLAVNVYDRFLFRFNRLLSSNATVGQNDEPYYEQRRGGSVTVSRPFSEYTRGFATLRTETVKANNLQVNYGALTNDQVNNIRGSLIQDGGVSSVTLRSATNTRDNEQDPATGFFFSPSVELGQGSFDYERPRLNPAFVSAEATPDVARILIDTRSQTGAFSKLNLDIRRYFSLSGPRTANLREAKKVIAGRLLLGSAQGNIGFAEQYFLGGVDTLRGYNDDRFWGNKLFLASVELRIPLEKQGTLTGALFADVGDAWGGTDINRENIPGFEQRAGFRPNFGFGFGIRVKTPIGPVRLDYGIGETNRTHFGIGQIF